MKYNCQYENIRGENESYYLCELFSSKYISSYLKNDEILIGNLLYNISADRLLNYKGEEGKSQIKNVHEIIGKHMIRKSPIDFNSINKIQASSMNKLSFAHSCPDKNIYGFLSKTRINKCVVYKNGIVQCICFSFVKYGDYFLCSFGENYYDS